MFQFLRIIFLINLCKDRVSPFFIPSSLFHSIPRLLIPSYPSLPSSFHTSPTHPILSIPPPFIPYLAYSSHPIHPSHFHPIFSIYPLFIPYVAYSSHPFHPSHFHLILSSFYIRRLLIPSYPPLELDTIRVLYITRTPCSTAEMSLKKNYLLLVCMIFAEFSQDWHKSLAKVFCWYKSAKNTRKIGINTVRQKSPIFIPSSPSIPSLFHTFPTHSILSIPRIYFHSIPSLFIPPYPFLHFTPLLFIP